MAGSLTNGGTMQTIGTILNPRVMNSLLAQKTQGIANESAALDLANKKSEQSSIANIFGGNDPLSGLTLPNITNQGRTPITQFKGLPGTDFNQAVAPTAMPQTEMRGNPTDTLQQLMRVPSVEKELGVTRLQNMLAPPSWHDTPQGGRSDLVDKLGNIVKTINGPAQKADIVNILENGKSTPTGFNMAIPEQAARANAILSAGAGHEVRDPTTRIDMNMTQEGKFAQTMGEGMAKRYLDLQDTGAAAGKARGQLGFLGDLLNNVDTGAGKGLVTQAKARLQYLGIEPAMLGLTDDTGPAQAAQSISKYTAMQLRGAGQNSLMPGSMSNYEDKILQSMPPGLENTKEGNNILNYFWDKTKQREQDYASWAREYKKANGGKFDEGFYDYAAKKSAGLNMFSDMQQKIGADLAKTQGQAAPGNPAPQPAPSLKAGTVVPQLPPDAIRQPDGSFISPSHPGKRFRPQ